MGSYIYTRRAKVVKTVGDEPITVNMFQYACKPYWDIWNYGHRIGGWDDDRDKNIARSYRMMQTNARMTTKRLTEKGDISEYFVILGEEGLDPFAIHQVFKIPQSAELFCDDALGTDNIPEVGKLVETDGRWVFLRNPAPQPTL